MPIDVSKFEVPETPYREYGGTQDFVNTVLQNRRFEYQKQKQNEVDEWRKLNLIQELTNLDKYQTGEATADAIGNQKASEILQRYTSQASTMSPTELQGRISHDMQNITAGMKGLRDELTQSDKDINTIKQLYPSIDTAKLRADHRADILGRRIKGDTDFANPLDIDPSQFNLGDPEFLSNYVSGSKSLRTLVEKPTTEKRQVLKGTPYNYVEYTAEIPSYMKENFDRANIKGGFLSGKDEPRLELRSTQLPAEALPSSSNKPFMIIDEDVYNGLGGSERLELISETRKKYPTYNSFSPEEKKLAERNVLHDFLSQNKSQYYPSQVKTPSASILKFYQGGGGDKDSEVNDLYKRINSEVDRLNNAGVRRFHVAILDSDAQKLILDFAKKATGEDLSNKEVFIDKSESGDLNVWDEDKRLIGTLPKVGVNIGVQPGVAEKREVIEQSRNATQSQPPKINKRPPLDAFIKKQ